MFDLTSFQLQNPWRGGGRIIPLKSFPRQLLNEVIAWLDDPDIIVIVGSRQVGKTTMIYQIIEHLFSLKLISLSISPMAPSRLKSNLRL